jgi:hypothetical protein
MMNRFKHLTFAAFAAYGALGCESGGVGDPCIPEDEYKQSFNGFALTEVNVESRSFQCETRVCIVNHFQGRVSCPYGQLSADLAKDPTAAERCRVPGTDGKTCVDNTSGNLAACGSGNSRNADEITVPVDPQRIFRATEDAVYCSCRCKGPPEEKNAVYCECPSGFVCEELVRDIGVPGRGQLVGSYCIKPGTAYDPTVPPDPQVCTFSGVQDGQKETATNPVTGKTQTRDDKKVCGVNGNGDPANPPL